MRITGLCWLGLASFWLIATGVRALGVSAADGDDECQDASDDAWTLDTWLGVYGMVSLCSMAVACLLYLIWDESTNNKRLLRILGAQCMLLWLGWTLTWVGLGIWVLNEHTDCHTHTLGITVGCLVGLQVLSCFGWVLIMWHILV